MKNIKTKILSLIYLGYPFALTFGAAEDESFVKELSLYNILISNYSVLALVSILYLSSLSVNKKIYFFVLAFILYIQLLGATARDGAYDLWNISIFVLTIGVLTLNKNKFFFSHTIESKFSRNIVKLYLVLMACIQALSLLAIPIDNYFTNASIGTLTENYNVYKPLYGLGFSLVFLFYVANKSIWRMYSYPEKTLFIFYIMTSIPFILSSRSSILGLLLTYLMALIAENKNLRKIIIPTIVSLSFLGFLFITDDVELLLSLIYDRYSSIKMIIFEMNNFPFGITPMGYSAFVENNNNHLVDSYGLLNSNIIILKTFYLAPESDVAYILATFGYPSIFIFTIILIALHRSLSIYEKLEPNEKMWMMISWYIILSGLGEDSAGQYRYYILISPLFMFIFNPEIRKKFNPVTN